MGLPVSHVFSFVRTYPLDNFMDIFTSNRATCAAQEPGDVSAVWEELQANSADGLKAKQRSLMNSPKGTKDPEVRSPSPQLCFRCPPVISLHESPFLIPELNGSASTSFLLTGSSSPLHMHILHMVHMDDHITA